MKNQTFEFKAIRNGNTLLIASLMELVDNVFLHDEDLIYHMGTDAHKQAVETLVDAGFADKIGENYKLRWDKLEERFKEIKGGKK